MADTNNRLSLNSPVRQPWVLSGTHESNLLNRIQRYLSPRRTFNVQKGDFSKEIWTYSVHTAGPP